ncbi:MAG TPA: DUF6752 domain-containing protein [Nocardioidaceae bacterium]|nr:DUF6752 domain-containing protein [Nocardioidaceae bacterium]
MNSQENPELAKRVKALEQEMQEVRQLNRRLADVLDVVTELLVPAMDRDDARVRAALERLDKFV